MDLFVPCHWSIKRQIHIEDVPLLSYKWTRYIGCIFPYDETQILNTAFVMFDDIIEQEPSFNFTMDDLRKAPKRTVLFTEDIYSSFQMIFDMGQQINTPNNLFQTFFNFVVYFLSHPNFYFRHIFPPCPTDPYITQIFIENNIIRHALPLFTKYVDELNLIFNS